MHQALSLLPQYKGVTTTTTITHESPLSSADFTISVARDLNSPGSICNCLSNIGFYCLTLAYVTLMRLFPYKQC